MLRCYYMDISCDCSYEQSQVLYGLLPSERQAAVNRLKNEEQIKKKILSGTFLQYALSVSLNIPMKRIFYQYGEYGKPVLDKGMMQDCQPGKCCIDFNLSHSGKYVVLAVSDSLIGIDVEGRKRDRLAVARRCFNKKEYEDIRSAHTEQEQDMRFLEYWTMKEAYVKYLGEGLRIPFHSFRIKRMENALSYLEKDLKTQNVYFATLFLEDLYCISICSSCYKELEEIRQYRNSFSNFFQEVSLKEILGAGI